MKKNLLTTLSVTAAVLALCFAVSRTNHTEKQISPQELLPPTAETTADWEPRKSPYGLLLASHVAQLSRDWENANTLLTDFSSLGGSGDDLRHMTIALSAGDLPTAITRAKKVLATKEIEAQGRELALMTLFTDALKQNNVKQAQTYLDQFGTGAIASLIKPLGSVWLDVAQKKNISAQTAELPGAALLHMAMAYETVGKQKQTLETLRKLQTYVAAQSPISNGIAASIALRAGDKKLAEAFLPNLAKAPTVQDALSGLKNETNALMPGGASLLDWHLQTPQKGLSVGYFDLARFFLSQTSTDTALLFAQLGSWLSPDLTPLAALKIQILEANKRPLPEILAAVQSIKPTHEGYAQLQIRLSEILSEHGNEQEALTLLKPLLEGDAGNTSALHYAMADLYRKQKNYKQAVEFYNAAIALDKKAGKPENTYWYAFYFRAIAEDGLKNWDKAEADLQKALALNPDSAYVLNYLGYSWADKNLNLKEASTLLQQALDLAPSDPYIIDSVGWVAFKQGDVEKAQRHLELALQLKPYDPTLNEHMGDIYYKLGRTREAQYQWLRALTYATDTHTDDEELIPRVKQKLETAGKGLEVTL